VVFYHVKIQTSFKEEKVEQAEQADPMGAFLDRAKEVRDGKKGPSRQAYCRQKKLEKDQE